MTTPRRAPRKPAPDQPDAAVYRFPNKRKNNPPAGLASLGRVSDAPPDRYSYDPHLPPVLRFDATGHEDHRPDATIAQLLEKAQRELLSAEEAQKLAAALAPRQPWLEWTGKREKPWFDVDPIALHIHERVSAQAILKVAAREDVQRSFWADPALEYHEAVQFYRHEVDWSNRLILGDNLLVMNSLAKREDLAGKVQMIYMDPPYGIRYGSNFQPLVNSRNVTDRDADLTRQPETIKAYRDTWTLGVHSYLAYLRDRLVLARELLADSGSIFVQIGDENVHRVRAMMDEIFGANNFVSIIVYQTSGSTTAELLSNPADYIIWYAKDRQTTKYRPLYLTKEARGQGGSKYTGIELPDGRRMPVSAEGVIPDSARSYRLDTITSQGYRVNTSVPFTFQGRAYDTGTLKNWKTTLDGMARLAAANRIEPSRDSLNYVRYIEDFPVLSLTAVWSDIGGVQSRADPKVYVVQTSTSAIERCILMTTEPGDLVLDPTCGSGTTAYVAEQWGRRWITIDTSRVALALARQRLLTARFDHFKTRDGDNQIHRESFRYKSVPHITLKSIAQNTALDPIFALHEPVLRARLDALNEALREVTPELRSNLLAKLETKRRRRDRDNPVTDADERRWKLPRERWAEWEVPFDTDPDWPERLRGALENYRSAWRAKMDDVNGCIAAAAEPEELVDQPEIARGVVRVTGPFTVEAVQPREDSLDASPIDEPEEPLETFAGAAVINTDQPVNAEAYVDKMLRLLLATGVQFPGNRRMKFARLDRSSRHPLHAEGEWASGAEDGDESEAHKVAVAFGPQYGPITALQVEECIRAANRGGFDDLVFAGFSFDAMAQAAIQADAGGNLCSHVAHISPDENPAMDGLLKTTQTSQIFTVFGLPRSTVKLVEGGEWQAVMEGVDIYDPVSNSVLPTNASRVAAWFLDTDYDGRTFLVCQAFFPDKSAWEKLSRAVKGVIDESRFAAFSGTVSLPFPVGKHRRVAVKVIDPRGNEVMRVHELDGVRYG